MEMGRQLPKNSGKGQDGHQIISGDSGDGRLEPVSRDRHWLFMWQSYMDFMARNNRRPSKYSPDERALVNWMKHNRKLLNKGELRADRVGRFSELLAASGKCQRINQYAYLQHDLPGLFEAPVSDVSS